MTERNPAIHAPRRLSVQLRRGQRFDEFVKILHPFGGLFIAAIVAFDLKKSGRLPHSIVSKPHAVRRVAVVAARLSPLALDQRNERGGTIVNSS